MIRKKQANSRRETPKFISYVNYYHSVYQKVERAEKSAAAHRVFSHIDFRSYRFSRIGEIEKIK
jgi:hypothetical protein